jgi:Tol biopolymer transport system component
MRFHFTCATVALALVVLTSASPLSAGIVKQVTDSKDVSFDWPMPNGDGSEIFVATSSNDGGGNPNHLFRIVAYDTTTGAATPITSLPGSLVHLRHNITVSEDGQWLAFISNGDLIPGQNPTRADQAFSIKRDGTSLTQLTHITGPNGGGVIRIAMAGTADRVMIATSADLTGGNPQRAHQVFVMKRDGSNLIQVTNAPSGSIDHLWISDDGTRIAFNHTGDLTGGNPDRNNEVFAITVGDALPRQITSSTEGASDSANISGDGNTIVFESTADYSGEGGGGSDQVFVADWTTGAITQLTFSSFGNARQPWPTNDGSEIFFALLSTASQAEIYRINRDGTDLTQLTAIGGDAAHPVVSGDGSHFGVWLDNGLYSGLGSGMSYRTLISRSVPVTTYAEMSTDGQKACLWSTADLTGANPYHLDQVFHVNTDGTGLRQLSNGTAIRPAMNGAGTRVYYESTYDPLGTNPDRNLELFGINSDGTGLMQYTSCTANLSGYVAVSDDGNTIVFASFCNLTGGNPSSTTAPLFKIKPDGTGLTQLTAFPAASAVTYFYYPRMDQTATWMAFSGNANVSGSNPTNNFEVFRQRTNGTGFQKITSYYPYWSLYPDISGDASKIVFQSQGNPLGQNGDHNYEIFLYQPAAVPPLRQLTVTTKSSNEFPRISRDGHYVYFTSGAELLENDPDHAFVSLYRYDLNTDTIQRSGGLKFENTSATVDTTNARWQPSVSPDGSKVVYSTFSNASGANPDEYWEIEFLDYNAPNPLVISGGSAPTTVAFNPEPGIVRYDIIRGSVANLHNAGSTVNMGAVTCLKDDSGDTSTAGYPDALTPSSGEVFFYLFRGTMGSAAGPGSYGTGTAGERVAGSGDCNP